MRIETDAAVDGQRRDDDVDAAAVLQPGIADRAGFVDPPADAGDDPLRDVHDVLIVAELNVRELELAAPLDVDLLGPVDHDVGDALVPEQRLERPEADHVVDDGGAEQFLLAAVKDSRCSATSSRRSAPGSGD